jgi:uncharacterized OsmC-like protein
MRLILETETSIRLAPEGPELTVEARGETMLSPFHLLAASLAMCTWSVLAAWAGHAGLSGEGLELAVSWQLGGDPVRVADVALEIEWPGLPAGRRAAAVRAARHCTIHHTLEHGARVTTRVAAS